MRVLAARGVRMVALAATLSACLAQDLVVSDRMVRWLLSCARELHTTLRISCFFEPTPSPQPAGQLAIRPFVLCSLVVISG